MRASKSYVRLSIAHSMARVDDISSSTLICAREFYDEKRRLKKILDQSDLSVLKNILEANDFDAIPLVDDKGMITRVARRRYHDGDPEDIFIIQADEVEELLFKDEDGSNILDIIFFVISSEHHVALTGPSLDRENCRIVTLDTLARESVRIYLDHKVADISSNSEPLDAHLGRVIFDGIEELKEKAKKAGSKVPDLEFTKHAVELLESMQSLKSSTTTISDESLPSEGEAWHLPGESGPLAREIAIWPMWGVLEDGAITLLALNSLCSANKFDNLLVYENRTGGVARVRRKIGTRWLPAGFKELGETASLDEVIMSMKEAADGTPGKQRKGPVPAVIIRGDERHLGDYGIITQEELLSPPVMHELLTRLTTLESDLKDYLKRNGITELKIQRGVLVNVEKVSLGILVNEEIIRDNFDLSQEESRVLAAFRSTLVHELFAGRGELDIDECNSAMAAERKIRAILDD